MKTERKVLVDGVLYPVILSDEQETLLAAKAAGRVFVGVTEKGGAARLWGAEYVAEAEPERENENTPEDSGIREAGGLTGEAEAEDLIRRQALMRHIWSGLCGAAWGFHGESVRQNAF